MTTRYLAASCRAALAVSCAGVALLAALPAQASTTLSLVDGYLNGAPLAGSSSSGSDTVTLNADGGGGVTLSGMAMTDVGINRLVLSNSPTLPFANTASVISGISFWADNLVAVGGVDPIHMTINFSFEGSYIGRLCAPFELGCNPDNPSSTFGNAYFVAAKGRLDDIFQTGEDGPIQLVTNGGNAILQGQNTVLPAANALLDVASVCPEDDGEDGCDPFSVSKEFAIDFWVNPGEEFFLASYFFVGALAQGETVDAFHTVKLTGIETAPSVDLTSESGKIVKLGSGSFGLPGAVPEPSTWALMIVGFGAVGGAMRRRRKAGAASSGIRGEKGQAHP